MKINPKSKETKAQKQKHIISYLTIYNDALKYAEEFFHYEMIRAFVMQKDGHDMSASILSIQFVTEDWDGGEVNGKFSVLGHQVIIQVLLQESELTEELKSEIRHEIIHYVLWLAGLPFDDYSVEFWAMATVYDAMPYEILAGKTKEYFDVFIRFYREHIESMEVPWNCEKPITIANAVRGISVSETVEAYQKYRDAAWSSSFVRLGECEAKWKDIFNDMPDSRYVNG